MAVPLRDIIDVLNAAYPPRLAEAWDTAIGLTCGDLNQDVDRVLLAVDVDPVTVAEAERMGAQLLLTHHPLLFRPVQTVAASTDKGALLHRLIRSGVAHFAAHTNADRAVGGVNDALADALGLRETTPLVPASDGADPREGLGRVGALTRPLSLGQFAAAVAAALPATASGVRVTGDASRTISRVAVCGGSGGGELAAASAAEVDAFVTSDITHHTAQEHAAVADRPVLVDIAHWAGEWPWLERARNVILEAFSGSVEADVSLLRTDAWSLHIASPRDGGDEPA